MATETGTVDSARQVTPSRRSMATSAVRAFLGQPGAGIFLFLVALLVVLGSWAPVMLKTTNLLGILNQMVFVLILTYGLTLVIIAGGLDLSVGSVLGLSGGISAYLIAHHAPLPVGFAAGLLCGAVLGFINGLVITRLRVPDFIATLAMLGVVRGALYVWTNAIPIRNYMSPPYYVIGGLRMVFWKITVPLLVALVLLLVIDFILRRTHYGVHLRATGSNPEAAKLSGINPDRVKVAAYVVSGTLAAIAGVLLAGRLTTVHPDMGSGYELRAIAAAVMGGAALSGGRGSLYGALVGAVTLTVIQNAINILNIDPNWEHVIVGAIILFAVLIDRGALALAGRKAPAH
jgi:ribose/xylose/arabinose/galactoside ABC-type transport system permease subunit